LAAIALLCTHATLAAQVLPDSGGRAAEPELRLLLEDATIANLVEAGADYTVLTDELAALLRKPLDLNTATHAQLGMLPGVGPLLAQRMLAHQAAFGDYVSLYELQAVEGMTKEVFDRIRPFITVAEIKVDKSMDKSYTRGPTWRELQQGGRVEVIQRVGRILEAQKGYTPPDTTGGNPTQRYAGDPYLVYTRLRYQYGTHVSAGLTLEKDPGEVFAINPAQHFYGYDFTSGHVFARDYGRVQRLVIGDYTLQTGQGLLFSRGLGFGRGAEPVVAAKQTASGILPYVSVNENVFMRGAAATVALGPVRVTGLASNLLLDASPAADTSGANPDNFAAIQRSGLHRTPTERANRATLRETIAAAQVAWEGNGWRIATTHALAQYGRGRTLPPDPYRRFEFAGTKDYLASVEWDWSRRNFNFFGEVARSENAGGSWAGIVGVLASLAPAVDVALQARRFDAGFHTLRGYAFAERGFAINNEQGIYLGVTLRLHPRWAATAYLDQYQFAQPRFRVSAPSMGTDALVQLNWRPSKTQEYYIRYRSDNGQRDVPQALAAGPIVQTTNTRRNTLRADASWQPLFRLGLHSRAEVVWFAQDQANSATGWLLLQDVRWQVHRRVNLTTRYALFNIAAFDARIYAFEPDVPTAFSIPAYQGAGQRLIAQLNWEPMPRLDLWLRIAQTTLPGRTAIGSGLDQTRGAQQTEVTVQVRYVLERR
jgi:hypothetical protein